MSNSPAFQFYPADWLSDSRVAVMTCTQEGAYIRAVCFCWREGSIPSDLNTLRRILSKPESALSDEDLRVVQGCFNQSPTGDGSLVHGRLEKEREKQAEWKEKSRSGGIKSGEKRKNKANLKGGSRVVEPNGNSLSSSLSLSLSLNPPIPPLEPNPSAKTEFWKPLCEVFGLEPKTHGDELRLWEQCQDFKLKAGTADEMRRRAGIYRVAFPNVAFTPKAVLSNWDILKEAPKPKQSFGPTVHQKKTRALS